MAVPGEKTINELAQLSVEEQIDQRLAAEQHQSGESWESVRSSLEEQAQ